VDVGHGQLHDKLRRDPRVTNLEKMNARHLAAGDLPRADYDVVVMDLSFISLKTVLPAVWPFLRPGGTLIALVKPQFEAGRAEVQKGEGIIRDDLVRERVLAEVRDFAVKELPGATVRGEMECPVHGADGNREYLLGLAKT
jgi:23S rRNA (cytidine1920-2'-O)/16S rRNA (cytidine1409-2'-O)-methyltransferase